MPEIWAHAVGISMAMREKQGFRDVGIFPLNRRNGGLIICF
jgi:hypothetical protein